MAAYIGIATGGQKSASNVVRKINTSLKLMVMTPTYSS
ncbi:hypothetical protein BSU04_05055 [Caballeronia sordidicola]|uniref:Uncharacterized protein n=1 Tax=Caballeronia sordidicola TaxID=196367 RepID=A0A226X8I4_CABSO|nr:hypothetical protein BSU04_05055 [Caballeronia sordidicola]